MNNYELEKGKIVEALITDIAEELKSVVGIKNISCNDESENPYAINVADIPLMIITLKQQLGADSNHDIFLKEIHKNDYYVEYAPDYTGWSYGTVRIYMNYVQFNLYFKIYDDGGWYCECEEGDSGYNRDKGCCGNVCDWDNCKIIITQEHELDTLVFTGTQSDYWRLEDEFYTCSPELKLRGQIEKLEAELKKAKWQLECY